MSKKGLFISKLILFLGLIPLSYAQPVSIQGTKVRMPVPVKVSVVNENWGTAFSICNITTQAIPLTDIEFNFNYAGRVTGTLWGIPWAAWHIVQNGSHVQLLGGTPWTPPLEPDPTCKNPMTVVFAAGPDVSLPTGPFIFKSKGAISPTLSETAQANSIYSLMQVRPASWDNIKHVVVIVLENTNADDALAQPFMRSLTTKGAFTSQFFALTHPSQPNYIGMIAGSLLEVDSNDDVTLNALHIGDLLNTKGLAWKAYAEDLPSTPCFKGDSRKYDRKHEPFISFASVQNNPTECAKIVNAKQFFTDLAADKLPTYSLYIPNENNNGHDTSVAFADRWLSRVFGPIFNDPKIMADTLFIITFDEDESGNNRIYTSFVGAAVKAGSASAKHYTLYSMLRTIEEILQLGTLGQNDQSAPVISDIWQS